MITIHLIVDVIFNVDCFLCNLSEEKNSKREIDLLNFIAVVIFKRCWYLSILTEELAAIFWSSYSWRESRSYYQKVIIKKARRAKNEVGRRSKSKQLDKIETENDKPGKRNPNKLPLRVLIRRINHCCQNIISEYNNTNRGFSTWHYFASVSSEVRRSEDSMPKKPWKESFLALFYDEFPAKISVSRAFLEP